MRRRVSTKSGRRRTVAGATASTRLTLDDRPLGVRHSRDGKRLIVALPYEIWIVTAATFELERTIEVPNESPSVFEGAEGVLWIGGQHLYRGSLFAGSVAKVGTKLGGFVDRVCLVRPTLLCGAGSHGEVLWDTETEEAVHRRKTSEHEVLGLVAAPDGRAVWSEGKPYAWVIDPDHAEGYMKLPLRHTSAHDVEHEAIARLGLTHDGCCVLACADGGIGWTNRALRMAEERFPRTSAAPVDLCGDGRFIYVLRSGGLVHRFLVASPDEDDGGELPGAQACGLDRRATCVALGPDDELVFGGPHDDMGLGVLWKRAAKKLPWEPLELTKRRLLDDAPTPADKAPSFVATRTRVEGAALRERTVDQLLEARERFSITTTTGAVVDRPLAPATPGEVKPADTVVLPAMVRLREGTARPAMLLWPGSASGHASEPRWLVWGDEPRGWTLLSTPKIREQGWARRDVFPLEIALAARPPRVPGVRAEIPQQWCDAARFDELAKECKRLLKVLW